MSKLLNRHTVIFLLISIVISVASFTINTKDASYLEGVLNFSSNSSNILSSFLDYFDFGYSFIAGSLAAVNPCGIVMLPVYLALYINGEKDEKSPSFTNKINNSMKVIFSVGSGFIILFVLMGKVWKYFIFGWKGVQIICLLVVQKGVEIDMFKHVLIEKASTFTFVSTCWWKS